MFKAAPPYKIMIIPSSAARKEACHISMLYLSREPFHQVAGNNTTPQNLRSSKMARALNFDVSIARQSLDGNTCADLDLVRTTTSWLT